ncbi:hypothetical protein [uncultured Salipiger sp.]|uniref:hypothetical protein n=1 Tax=uncultured Salipiger sp. TaxID=499810 RepID=UPI00259312D6|nr:hypothetical protein [uncultured Salipiger sp.]MBR9840274.1 hypothetical protein [Paracoccaceae bacterium]
MADQPEPGLTLADHKLAMVMTCLISQPYQDAFWQEWLHDQLARAIAQSGSELEVIKKLAWAGRMLISSPRDVVAQHEARAAVYGFAQWRLTRIIEKTPEEADA